MIGNMIYLLFRQDMQRGGAFKRLQRIKEINRDAGYEVTESENGYLDCWLDGKLVYEYIVSTKTIQE